MVFLVKVTLAELAHTATVGDFQHSQTAYAMQVVVAVAPVLQAAALKMSMPLLAAEEEWLRVLLEAPSTMQAAAVVEFTSLAAFNTTVEPLLQAVSVVVVKQAALAQVV
jgi:hypothetical protein